ALFALGALNWEAIQSHVNWGIVVMYGGAICLGGVMERTGAAAWLTEQLLSGVPASPQVLMLGFAVLGAALTEFMSNSAVV
ncbi:MAG: SLC13 family permease, partial [Myxococcota bacterium]|nr:SLC13 family permease [Myxococcota bacterium]